MLPLQLPLQFCDANFVCQTFYWHILLQSCCHCCRCFCCYCSCCCWFVGLCCCCCCCLCRVVRQQTRLKLKCALFFARRARELRKQHLHILYRHRMCLCVCMGMCVSVSVCVCGFKASRLKCFMRSQARTLTVIAAWQAGSQSVQPANCPSGGAIQMMLLLVVVRCCCLCRCKHPLHASKVIDWSISGSTLGNLCAH